MASTGWGWQIEILFRLLIEESVPQGENLTTKARDHFKYEMFHRKIQHAPSTCWFEYVFV